MQLQWLSTRECTITGRTPFRPFTGKPMPLQIEAALTHSAHDMEVHEYVQISGQISMHEKR